MQLGVFSLSPPCGLVDMRPPSDSPAVYVIRAGDWRQQVPLKCRCKSLSEHKLSLARKTFIFVTGARPSVRHHWFLIHNAESIHLTSCSVGSGVHVREVKAAGGLKLTAYRHLVLRLRPSSLQPVSLHDVNGDNWTTVLGNCFIDESSHFTIRRCLSTSRRFGGT